MTNEINAEIKTVLILAKELMEYKGKIYLELNRLYEGLNTLKHTFKDEGIEVVQKRVNSSIEAIEAVDFEVKDIFEKLYEYANLLIQSK